MITLSYGYKKPEQGDRGAPLFQALEDNIQRQNDHSHNGVDSPALSAASLVGVVDSAPGTGWSTYSGSPVGYYRKMITVHTGFLFDQTKIGIRTAAGEYIYPKIERISNTQFYVYSTDNTLALYIIYGG